MLKPTIISISMTTVMAGAAISPALGVIAEAFSEASSTTIKMMLTAPSIAIIPFTFIASFLTTKLPKKTIILLALCLFLIGGVGAQFMPTMGLMILFRLILGAGVGLLMPLSQSLIYDYFTGEERTQMMGYNSAFSNFSGIATMLVAGWLARFCWRYAFYVYAIGILVFILILLFLPKGEIKKVKQNEEKSKLPISILGYALALGAIMLAYYSVATNIALYLKQSDLGGSVLAGIIVSLTTFGGMVTSLLLVQLVSILKKFLVPVMLLFMSIVFLLLAFTNSIPIVMLSVCFVGFGQGSLFPVITMKALDELKPNQTDKAIAIITSFIFIGQFLSPFILDTISKIANQTSIRFQFIVLSISILVSVMLIFINIWKKPVIKTGEIK